MLKVMTLQELVSHDVFEFCYSIRYPKHWNFDSVFVDYDEFICLSSYLEQVIPDYKYFYAQEITVKDWKQIENLALADNKNRNFFQTIDKWKQKDPTRSESFWVYGV